MNASEETAKDGNTIWLTIGDGPDAVKEPLKSFTFEEMLRDPVCRQVLRQERDRLRTDPAREPRRLRMLECAFAAEV